MRRTALLSVVWICALLAAALSWRAIAPAYGPVTYSFDNKETHTTPFPLSVSTAGSTLQASFTVHLASVHPNVFTIVPDDCLDSLSINGFTVEGQDILPVCDYEKGKTMNLSHFLKPGDNKFAVRMRDFGGSGGITMRADIADPLAFTFASLFALVLFGGWWLVARSIRRRRAASGATEEDKLWSTWETWLVRAFLLVSGGAFLLSLGHTQGFDAGAYLEVLDKVDWWKPLPGVRDTFYSFHPPFAYLLDRLVMFFRVDRNASVMVVAWSSIAGAVLLLRQTLRRIGALPSFSGVCFLGIAAGLPLYVFLAKETGQDALILFLSVLVLHLSVALFWETPPRKNKKVWLWAILLCATLIIGLLTKFNALLGFATPFVVIAVRHWRKPAMLIRSGALALAICAVAAACLAPFYYQRYYLTEHKWFPGQLEWQRADVLAQVRPERDKNPVAFVAHMLRLPEQGIRGVSEPIKDSFWHMLWLETWKRDAFLGPQTSASTSFSDAYSFLFLGLSLLGTVIFFVGGKKLRPEWRQFGWILLFMGALYLLAMLDFGYQYPVWDWRPFKAKYVAFALLWIPYAAAVALDHEAGWIAPKKRRQALSLAVVFLIGLFVVMNYALPVY